MGVASCKRLPCRSPLRDALRLVPGHCPRTPELIARDEPSHRTLIVLPETEGYEHCFPIIVHTLLVALFLGGELDQASSGGGSLICPHDQGEKRDENIRHFCLPYA
ncbi:hypothetical protein HYQ44_003974 [Verticillium longisporum]|nr:hypothetical protein HYQ44_003974 [Verticillium longisporum]